MKRRIIFAATILLSFIVVQSIAQSYEQELLIKVSSEVFNVEQGKSNGSGYYSAEDVVALEAEPILGYKFLRWMKNGDSQVSVINPYRLTVNDESVFYAEFERDWQLEQETNRNETYLITAEVSPANVGVVLNQGYYDEGVEVTIIASPNQEIDFIKWTENGLDLVDGNGDLIGATYTFIAEENRHLIAVFDGPQFSVTVASNPDNGGVTTVDNQGLFYPGDLATVTADPNAGFEFINWTLATSGQQASVNTSYSFTVNQNRSLLANYNELEEFTLSLTVNPENSGTVEGAGNYTYGSLVSISAASNLGYSFVYWRDGVELFSNYADTSFYITSNMDLEAYFSINSFQLQYIAGEGGVIDGLAMQSVDYGSSGTAVTAVANEGFQFVNWDDGSTDNPRTDLNITENLTFTANFEKVDYILTLVVNPSNAGSVSGSGEYNFEDEVELSAVANTGYQFANWTAAEGDTISSETNYVYAMPSANTTINANFNLINYTIDAIVNNIIAGSVSITPVSANYNYGNEITANAIANNSYVFLNWRINNQVVSSSNPYVFNMPAENIELKAYFVAEDVIIHTIASSAGNNGTVSPLGNILVEDGDNQIFEITEDFGYFIEDVLVDDVSIGAVSSYEFINVTENHTIHAVFSVNMYSLIYTTDGNGTIEENDEQMVVHGQDGLPVEAIPNTGYVFVKWSDDVTDNPRIDTAITENIDVEAIFTLIEYTLRYTADENGYIYGDTLQIVNYGSNGTTVEAIANTGYVFVKWSDDVTDNPRIDTAITENIDVEAIFTLIEYTLRYNADENGYIYGDTLQIVNYGSNGTNVEAIANTGYVFVKWSDDVTDNPRIDSLIYADIDVMAIFELEVYVDNILDLTNIEIYPNPNSGLFYISFHNLKGKTQFLIYDVKGNVIFSDVIDVYGICNKKISLNHIPGIYFIRLINENSTIVEKLIVQ